MEWPMVISAVKKMKPGLKGDIWCLCRKSVPGRGSHKCMGPEVEGCSECLKNSKAANISRVVKRNMVRMLVKRGIGDFGGSRRPFSGLWLYSVTAFFNLIIIIWFYFGYYSGIFILWFYYRSHWKTLSNSDMIWLRFLRISLSTMFGIDFRGKGKSWEIINLLERSRGELTVDQ